MCIEFIFCYHHCFLHLVDISRLGCDATPLRTGYSGAVTLRQVWDDIIAWSVRKLECYCCIAVITFILGFFEEGWAASAFVIGQLCRGLCCHVRVGWLELFIEHCMFGVELPIFGSKRLCKVLSWGHQDPLHIEGKFASRVLANVERSCSEIAGPSVAGWFSEDRAGIRMRHRLKLLSLGTKTIVEHVVAIGSDDSDGVISLLQ